MFVPADGGDAAAFVKGLLSAAGIAFSGEAPSAKRGVWRKGWAAVLSAAKVVDLILAV